MRLIKPGFEIVELVDGDNILKTIEKYGRVCYKSEDLITDDSAEIFVRKIIQSGHESVIEHCKISIKIICDRGVSHEIVRHRIASYSQESTRYCNYANEKFGNELTFIIPLFFEENSKMYKVWKSTMQMIEDNYNTMIAAGARPEEARSILPNSLKTEIIVTMNLREWRHFCKLRTSENAHPQMREIAIPILKELQRILPVVFEDINVA